jgi:hypothetical protein
MSPFQTAVFPHRCHPHKFIKRLRRNEFLRRRFHLWESSSYFWKRLTEGRDFKEYIYTPFKQCYTCIRILREQIFQI